jgi:hypothetical protein
MNRVVFKSESVHWATPAGVYDQLNKEFGFTHDPCPLGSNGNGLAESWSGKKVYCNPPYGPGIGDWLAKAEEADGAVYLLPARTDTKWFHQYCLQAKEIRFIKGRLKFGDAKNSAPFPSMIVVMK